mgnify:CR=1 FL=1
MKKHACSTFPHFLHGADYNPEQWIHDKSVWDEDMRLMKLANCNEMSVGIFSWSTLEPREGEYDFSFLDEIIDKVGSNGGKVILATPSGARRTISRGAACTAQRSAGALPCPAQPLSHLSGLSGKGAADEHKAC